MRVCVTFCLMRYRLCLKIGSIQTSIGRITLDFDDSIKTSNLCRPVLLRKYLVARKINYENEWYQMEIQGMPGESVVALPT